MSETPDREYFLKVNDSKIGPVSFNELYHLIKQGVLSPDDLIWDEAAKHWVAAQEFSEFSHIFKPPRNNHHTEGKIYAVASGKGGVGKSVLSASIAVALATLGHEIILVDADLAGANLHTCLGVLSPDYTFYDFYTGRINSLDDIVLDTPIENLRFISGACGTIGAANPRYHQKQRLIRGLKKLPADYVIVDLGAGTSFDVLDFFLLADEQLVVVSTEPAAVYEAFGFIKIALFRALLRALKSYPGVVEILQNEKRNRPGQIHLTVQDLLNQTAKLQNEAHITFDRILHSFKPKIILNKVTDRDEIKEGMAIQLAAKELLSLQVEYLGYISSDTNVVDAVKAMRPFLLHDPKSLAAQDLARLVRVGLLGKRGLREIFANRRWRKRVQNSADRYPVVEKNLNALICSDACFYWEHCEYKNEGFPCPVRHLEAALAE